MVNNGRMTGGRATGICVVTFSSKITGFWPYVANKPNIGRRSGVGGRLWTGETGIRIFSGIDINGIVGQKRAQTLAAASASYFPLKPGGVMKGKVRLDTVTFAAL